MNNKVIDVKDLTKYYKKAEKEARKVREKVGIIFQKASLGTRYIFLRGKRKKQVKGSSEN